MFAFVRPPGASFPAALSGHPRDDLDVRRARAQHSAYVDTLRRLDVEVVELPAQDALPDACFVEDCAVVIGGEALLCRPGAPSRRDEPATLLDALGSRVSEVVRMPPEATLDGGDVLRLGAALYVGRSARTNDAGVAALRTFALRYGLEVVPVTVPPDTLHLQTAATAVSDTEIIGDARVLAHPAFAQVPVHHAVPDDEPTGASVLRVGNTVVMAAGAPRTATMLRAAGHHVIELDLGEFTKADGGPTCLSLRSARGEGK